MQTLFQKIYDNNVVSVNEIDNICCASTSYINNLIEYLQDDLQNRRKPDTYSRGKTNQVPRKVVHHRWKGHTNGTEYDRAS